MKEPKSGQEVSPHTRADFLRDLGKASRKLEPEEKPPKRKRPSERSGGTA